MALVCQIDAALQPRAEGQLLRMLQSGIVQHKGIKFVAVSKATDLAEACAAIALEIL